MSQRPQNLLFILSDEHAGQFLGCAGHPLVKTPHIDRLAARGTRFSSAYTNSPVCVPARASMATGRYLKDVGFWDNADPYDGSVRSWHHAAREAGHHVAAIGKLHFRSDRDDNGFSEEQLTMHVVEGKGDLMGLVRDELPERGNAWKMAKLAGPGESSYTGYDREIASRAQIWLHETAPKLERPWCLKVSFVAPHFPLTAPPDHFYRYYDHPALPMPKLYAPEQRPDHPYLREYAASFAYDKYFDSPDRVRRAIAGYFGLCSFLDENIGKVLAALDSAGLTGNTRVIYASDHGDNLGARGLWGKSNMYEESVGVPMIVAGEGVPFGHVCRTPASLVDIYPTVLDCLGAPAEAGMPGRSLLELAQSDDPERPIFSEYHGMGSTGGVFMLRRGRYKYVHYVRYPAQLFDLEADPDELVDLAGDRAHEAVLARMRAELTALCDPAAVDRRAKARQQQLLAAHGGREAVVARGDLGFSPPPGAAADFR